MGETNEATGLAKVGDRIVVVDRKLFRDDNTRLFIGVVEHYENGVVRARGFSFHINPYEVAGAEPRAEERVRIVSLSAGDVIYTMPEGVDIKQLQVRRSPKSLTLTDNRAFIMDLSEWMYRV